MVLGIRGYGYLIFLLKAYSIAPLWLSVLAVISNCMILGQDLFWLISYSSDSVYFLPFGEKGHNGVNLMINRPLFSVGIELYFYLLAPFLLKSINRSFFLLFIGFLWLTIISYLGYERNIGLQYHAAPSAFMYFGLGAMSYHLSKLEQSYKAYFFLLGSGLLVVSASSLINGWLPLFMGLTIPMVFNLVKGNAIDNFIGEFSYLLYITHAPVIALLKNEFGLTRSLNLFLYTLFVSLFISIILFYSVDRYVAMYRAKKYGSGH